MLGREDGSDREWVLEVQADDTLAFRVRDDSAATLATRASDAVITQDAWHLFSATYTAATGGATAANDMTLYQDGAAIASTATNSGTYVAMENLTAPVRIGTRSDGASFFSGSMALVVISAVALSASDHWAIKKLVNSYFALSL